MSELNVSEEFVNKVVKFYLFPGGLLHAVDVYSSTFLCLNFLRCVAGKYVNYDC